MEFVESRGRSAGAHGLLVVPGPNYLDFEVDLDDDDEEVVIGIRLKSSPQPRRKTSVSEEESDISEPPSLSGSRRVSFADAVGLSLVQVKEFDKWDIPQLPDFLDDTNKDEDEYFIWPFNFPLSLPSEEDLAKVLEQKVELESVELLPGTTILKGVIRVLNISFTKAVNVRTSLDNWVSHFDLLSEYVPGSSDDGRLDRFAFKLTLVPPFAEQGARVDFCLRYETPNGTFWDNNSNKNYVLFCHKRRKEVQDKPQKEIVNKKSCLKTVSRSFSVEESMSSPERENLAADVTTRQKITNETQSNESDKSPVKYEDEANALQIESRRNRSRQNRRKAARMARVKDYFAQKDLTTQDGESQASSEKLTPTTQEQNQTTTRLNPKGSDQLADTDGSESKDSNIKTHENFNVADAATSANDLRRDESKDVPNAAASVLQNTNNFVSTGKETSPEAAGCCGHASAERDDSVRLVSDSASFAFGTVVAPLYHEVSGRGVGSQPYSEMHSSRSMKEQQETEERSSNADRNVCKDVGGCCSDEKVESGEQSATSSNDETLTIENAFEKRTLIQDSTKVQTNTMSDPVHQINSLNSDLVNASEKILEHENEIQSSVSSSDRQETFANDAFPTQLFENDESNCSIEMKRHETVLKTEEQDRQFELDSNSSDIDVLSLDKALDTSTKDFKYEENEDFVDQSASVNDMIVLPCLDVETCNINQPILPTSHVSKTVTENQTSNSQLSQNLCLLDPSTKTSNAKDENSLELEDQTWTVSPKHVSETPEDTDKSLFFEQTETLCNQATNTSNLISDQSPPSSASILTVSPMSEEENEQLLASKLSQNVDLSDHCNKSTVFEDQSMADSPTFTFEFLLVEQNKHLVDQPNNTRDLPSEVSLDDEDTQTVTSTTDLSLEENTTEVTMAMAQSDLTLLLEQNEDLENKSTTNTQTQELDENVEQNTGLLLERSCLLDHSTNHGNLIDDVYDCDAGSVAETSSLVSESLEENLNLPLQPSPNDKLNHPDELNIENDTKMLPISANLEISRVENVSLSTQNEELPDNISDSVINLDVAKKLSQTGNIFPSQDSTMDENASLPIQMSKCSSISLGDQPSNAKSLFAQSDLEHDSVKTIALLEHEEEKNCNANNELAGHECIASSGICFEMLELVTKGCAEIEQKETNNEKDLNESIKTGSVENAVESKTNIYCDVPDAVLRSVDVEDFGILSQIETMDITLEDGAKTWEVMVDEEQKNLDLQDTSEDIVDVVTNLEEDDKLENLDSKIDGVELLEKASSQSIGFEKATEDIEKKEDKVEELDLDAQVNNDTYFAPVFEDTIPSLCNSYEEIVTDCASVSSNLSVNEKLLNERIGSKSMDSMDKTPGCENEDVDEMGKVKIQSKTNEEERFKIPPRKVRSKLTAPTDNVQEGIRSSQNKIVEETTCKPIEIDKTDFLCCSKDTNDNTLAGDLKYDQNSDDDGHSESESGSEDEMELYMHCLRAVYGQQSSQKAIKPEQNRDEAFKRLPTTRSKRLSTSLPSISESLDEEQPIDTINVEEKEIETVQALPDSSLKEDDYLCWKQSFYCRNILKYILYTTLLVIFLAVAYHYDFIACFGLYVISLIWLFFQGDRQTGKNNS